MTTRPKLPLRNDGHRVDVVSVDGSGTPELGRRHPADEDAEARRIAVLRQWGYAGSPGQQPLATIDEALPQRTQTILSYRLPPEVRARINSGVGRVDEAGENHPLDSSDT